MKKISICFLIIFSTFCFANREVERLKEIVSINSGTSNITGVKKVMQKVAPWFEELGFKISYIENPEGKDKSAPLFIAELKGNLPDTITFVMHADTVFELTSPFQNFQISGDVINGPGVMDDKGGIVMTVRALEHLLKDQKTPKYGLRVIISPNEEMGSPGFSSIFKEYSHKTWLVLGLEPAYDDGGILEGRKGNIWYSIEVKGKEAHAGRDHKEGINACHLLSEKISKLQRLTNYKKNVTVSIGRIEGGQDKFNIVCGWAKAKIDVRVPSLNLMKEYKKKFQEILNAPHTSFTIIDDTPPFSTDKASMVLVKKYLSLIKETEGSQHISHFSGGVGDTNMFSREGVLILDGLGPIGGGAHTEKEFLNLSSIESRSIVLMKFLKSL